MKLTTLTLAALLLASGLAQAGERAVYSKDYSKGKGTPPPPALCFNDREWQFDIFGAYVDGNGPDHAGPWQDHGWGGGVGINYFFSRYVGIGIEGTALYGRENRQRDDRQQLASAKHVPVYSGNGSLIFRLPVDRLCLAPYAYVGGGISVDGDQWATGFGGVGLEYRIVPQKVSLFIDGRFTYYGDRYGNGDQNNYTGKAGIRFIF